MRALRGGQERSLEDVCELREQADQIEALIATVDLLTTRLAAADRRLKQAKGDVQWQRRVAVREARAKSPAGEVEPTTVVGDMHVPSLTQTVIVDGVPQSLTVMLGKHPGDTRVSNYELTELDIVVDPDVRSVPVAGGVSGEDERDSQPDYELQLKVRLVAHVERDASDDESSAVLGHGDSSHVGEDQTIDVDQHRNESHPEISVKLHPETEAFAVHCENLEQTKTSVQRWIRMSDDPPDSTGEARFELRGLLPGAAACVEYLYTDDAGEDHWVVRTGTVYSPAFASRLDAHQSAWVHNYMNGHLAQKPATPADDRRKASKTEEAQS